MSQPAPNNPRRLGVVTRLTTQAKGYVFIRGEDGVDYFAHHSAFATKQVFDGLLGGEAVTFHVGRTEKGFRANRIEFATRDEELARLARVERLEDERGNI